MMKAVQKNIWFLFLSECIGTALLLAIGLSIVIFNWGRGSPVTHWIPSEPLRRLFTGFLFGCTGCLVTLSPVGKISGAHINPAVSIAFWLRGKMKFHAMLGFIASQMLGAVLGCLVLLCWGEQGRSVGYGNTVPGLAGIWPAFLGELICTAFLIADIFICVGSNKLKKFTPFTMPLLYGIMVWAETIYSGCSTNPARSFGPALVSGIFSGYWIYWAAPLAGVFVIVAIFRIERVRRYYHIESARVGYAHHQIHDSLKSS